MAISTAPAPLGGESGRLGQRAHAPVVTAAGGSAFAAGATGHDTWKCSEFELVLYQSAGGLKSTTAKDNNNKSQQQRQTITTTKVNTVYINRTKPRFRMVLRIFIGALTKPLFLYGAPYE